MVFRSLLMIFCLTACDALVEGARDLTPSPDARPTPGADAPDSATAAAATAAPAPEPSTDGTVRVKNPLGVEIEGEFIDGPAAGSAEHTILAALNSQASNGGFDAFVRFMHPSTKSETEQVDRLRAYTWEQSKGTKAAQCLQRDGTALVVVARREISATVEGGGPTGTRLSVWCGEGRMPVPFTLYPDGDVYRFTQFGLN